MNRSSEDEAWRAIVDNYGERARLDDDEDPKDSPAADDAEDSNEDVDLARIAELTGAGAPAADDLPPELRDEPFVPPTPPPLPRPAPARLAAWVGVLAMPALLLVLLVLQSPPPTWVSTAMVLWFLGGFAYLVASMPSERPDDPDNGARV